MHQTSTNRLSRLLLPLWASFLLALGIRVAFLVFNLSWNLAPEWTSLTRASLAAAELISGLAPSIDYPSEEAMGLFKSSDRGTALAHLILIKIFGGSSFLGLRMVNLLLDSTMVLVCFRIGKILGGERLARASALLFAVFPPAVFICINPFWYTWLSSGALVCSWIGMEMVYGSRILAWALPLAGASLLTTQFRSTFVFYLLFLGAWIGLSWFFCRGPERAEWPRVRRAVGVILICGALNVFSGSIVNKALYGGAEPMRSDFGHVLWVGIGEFPNPMGVIAEDSSVGGFYLRATGKSYADLNFTGQGWKDYNTWLFKEGLKFIGAYPALYASMVIRRCLKFIFPNFRVSRISDLESYNVYEEKILGTRSARLAIVKTDRIKTFQGLRDLWKIDKSYFFEGALRVGLMFLLPLLLLLGAWSLGPTLPLAIAASFFAYNLATLGPIRGPDMNLFSVWCSVVPLLAAGALCILARLNRAFPRLFQWCRKN